MQYFLVGLRLNITELLESKVTYNLHYLLVALKIYFTPCLVGIGLFANVVNILVFLRSRLRKVTCAPYLTLLSVVDVCFLVALFSLWLINAGFDIYRISGGCQAVTLVMSGSSFISVWAVTALALDRLLMVYPNIHPCLLACPGKRPKLLALCIGAGGFAIFLNLCLLYSSYQTDTGQIVCIPMPEFIPIMGMMEKLDAIFDFLIPSILLVIMNIVIVYFVHRILNSGRVVHRVRQRNTNIATMQQRSKVELNMTKLALVVTMTFLVLNLPGHLLRFVFMVSEGTEYAALAYEPNTFLIRQLLMNLFFLRSSICPFMCFISSSLYRKAVCSKLSAVNCFGKPKCLIARKETEHSRRVLTD